MTIKLSADQISANWDLFISNIDTYISEPRRSQLKTFYTKYQERIMLMPASNKKEYHSHILAHLKVNTVLSLSVLPAMPFRSQTIFPALIVNSDSSFFVPFSR